MLMSAIHLTVPDFNIEEINKCLYAFDEIKAIIQIANIYLNLNRNDQAIDIFYQLLKYVRNHYREVITSGKITLLVLYNYARALDLCGRYEDGMHASNTVTTKHSLVALKYMLNVVIFLVWMTKAQKPIIKPIISAN